MYLPETLCAWASHRNCARTPTINTTTAVVNTRAFDSLGRTSFSVGIWKCFRFSASFNGLGSMQIRRSPFFFSPTTMFETQSLGASWCNDFLRHHLIQFHFRPILEGYRDLTRTGHMRRNWRIYHQLSSPKVTDFTFIKYILILVYYIRDGVEFHGRQATKIFRLHILEIFFVDSDKFHALTHVRTKQRCEWCGDNQTECDIS